MKLRTGLRALILTGCAVVTAAATASAPAQAGAASAASGQSAAVGSAAATTPRFWSGTDSNYMAVRGTPYREPVIGGSYGGYIGMIGNWANWRRCGGVVVWSKTDSRDARINYQRYHLGVGVGAYWFMGGPGVDPRYNGRLIEASNWGVAQAKAALADLAAMQPAVNYPVLFMDIEIPGDAPRYTPASDNGWNSVYTSPCSGRVRIHHIPANVDRAEFNGFANYLTSHSAYKAGVYSAPGIWASIFGTGSYASIPNTYEWTYMASTRSLSHHPSGWCLAGTRICAQFFGGITRASKYALMWQWSGGGGNYNGYGDFDQIDGGRTP